MRGGYRYCANVGCTEYNKQFGGKVVRKKAWCIDLNEACGSIITNKKPNVSKIDTLVEKFVIDYNYNMEMRNNATKEEE